MTYIEFCAGKYKTFLTDFGLFSYETFPQYIGFFSENAEPALKKYIKKYL